MTTIGSGSGERPQCICGRRPATFLLGVTPKCFTCAISYPRLLRRSLATALVVGTVLVAINQGTVLAAGDLPSELAWKVPLTYCVPFCVATWGALINTRI